jgi:hypothetical protein
MLPKNNRFNALLNNEHFIEDVIQDALQENTSDIKQIANVTVVATPVAKSNKQKTWASIVVDDSLTSEVVEEPKISKSSSDKDEKETLAEPETDAAGWISVSDISKQKKTQNRNGNSYDKGGKTFGRTENRNGKYTKSHDGHSSYLNSSSKSVNSGRKRDFDVQITSSSNEPNLTGNASSYASVSARASAINTNDVVNFKAKPKPIGFTLLVSLLSNSFQKG